MREVSVTLRHPEGYALGGLVTMTDLFIGSSAFFRPLAGIELAIIGTSALAALWGFYRAASWERLDQTGIFLKRPFFQHQYTWAQVQSVRIVPMDNGNGMKTPRLQFTVPGRSTPLNLACTKRSLAAVQSWYGTPDEDLWGRDIDRF